MLTEEFKRKTTAGLLMAAGVVVISKFMAIISQWVLGYHLAPAEFGEYALVLGAMAFVGFLQDPGIGRLHTQMRVASGTLWKRSFVLSQALALVGGVSVVAIVYGAYDADYDLFMVALFCALSFPIVAFNSFYKSRLEIRQNYKVLAKTHLALSLVNGLFLIGFSVVGVGALTFTLALFLSSLSVAIYIYIKTKKLNENERSEGEPRYGINVFWAMVGTFVLGFSLRSDYFIVGLTLDEREVGIYYFGFMLAANVALVISQSIGSVLMPAFSSLQNLNELNRFYFSSCRKLLVSSSFLAFTVIAISPALINWIWQGKWDDSIVVCQLFLITFPLRLLVPASLAYLEARGLWRDKALCLAIDGVTLALACWVGVESYGLTGAVLGAAIQRGTFGLAAVFWSMYIASRLGGLIVTAALTKDMILFYISIASAAIFVYIYSYSSEATGYVIFAVLFILIYLALGCILSRDVYLSLYNHFVKLIFNQ